jgi:hypothetical protein
MVSRMIMLAWPLAWPFDSDWTLVIVTSVLVGITAYYAIQTKRLTKVPFTPSIQVTSEPTSSGNIIFYFTNLGPGTAIRVKAEYRIPVSNQTDKKEFPFILPQGFNQWTLPVPQPERHTTLEIHLNYEYRDILTKDIIERRFCL